MRLWWLYLYDEGLLTDQGPVVGFMDFTLNDEEREVLRTEDLFIIEDSHGEECLWIYIRKEA